MVICQRFLATNIRRSFEAFPIIFTCWASIFDQNPCGREREREGGREGERERGREGGREREREGERERGGEGEGERESCKGAGAALCSVVCPPLALVTRV